ncbi:MAG TPA: CotH kinase family protein [Terriglobia bacterium]|nr:CotH kinase family protein [Terriglobia bacterium]
MLNRGATLLMTLLMLSVVAIAQRRGGAEEPDIFGLTTLHHVRVSISRDEWAALQTSNGRGGGRGQPGKDYTDSNGRMVHVGGGFQGYYPWVHADLLLDDVEVKDAGLRYRGNFSFTQSSAANPLRANFKVKTDLFSGAGDWRGVKTLNFNAGVLDPSLMCEAMAFALFRAAGVPASRMAYAEITFRAPEVYADTPGGLYLLVENVNKRFLKRALPPGGGLLFKPEGLRGGIQFQGEGWASYENLLRPNRETTPEEQRRVIDFARLISQGDDEAFRTRIGAYLDIDEFLRFVAVHAFIVNTDSYIASYHNYYLYLDPKDDRFRFIPWDQDLSLGTRGATYDMQRPYTGNHPLISRLLDDPAVAEQYRAILKELSEKIFTGPGLHRLIDELEQRAGDGRGAPLRSFVDSRVSSLQKLVAP